MPTTVMKKTNTLFNNTSNGRNCDVEKKKITYSLAGLPMFYSFQH